jgi:hypothetical protein
MVPLTESFGASGPAAAHPRTARRARAETFMILIVRWCFAKITTVARKVIGRVGPGVDFAFRFGNPERYQSEKRS